MINIDTPGGSGLRSPQVKGFRMEEGSARGHPGLGVRTPTGTQSCDILISIT